MTSISIMVAVFFIALAGGFIGSVAGGAALFEIPALLIAGVPVHSSIGSFKVGNVFSAGIGAYNYTRKGCVERKIVLWGALPVLLGSLCGGILSCCLSKESFEGLVFILLSMALILMFFPVKESQKKEKTRFYPAVILLFFPLSVYGGFLGGGIGTLFILLLAHGLKLDIVKACGTGRAITFGVELGCIPVFLLNGYVEWLLVLPLALGGMTGSFIGSGLAMKKGCRFIRPMMLAVIVATLAAAIYNRILS